MKLTLLDILVVAVYLTCIGGAGLWLARGVRTTRKFFTADRSMPSWVVAFALMATIVGSGTFVGHPGTAFQEGLILFPPIFLLPVILIFVSIWIVPFYRRVVRMSSYEYLGQRFGGFSRVYGSLGFLGDRIFDLAFTLVTTGIALYVFTGWSPAAVVVGVGVFTLFYTMIGGITAVAWTNVAQGIILSGAAVFILARILFAPEIGDPAAIVRTAWDAGRFTPGSWDFSWSSFYSTGTPVAWLLLFAYAIQWSRRYVTDQHIVQHYLIARSDRAASRGAFMGALACLPVFSVFMVIGVCLYGFFALNGADPGPAKGDEVMPYFLAHYMPSGVLGLMLAAVLAAAMSSVSADLNSIATVLTTDYFVKMRPASSERARLIFGRGMVLSGGLAATWIAVLLLPREGSAPVVVRTIIIATIISGGSLGLFALGFFTRRAGSIGAHAGIVACLVFTAWGLLSQADDQGKRLVDFGFNWEMNPLLIGVFGHFVLFSAGYAVSLLARQHDPKTMTDLTIWSHRLRSPETASHSTRSEVSDPPDPS